MRAFIGRLMTPQLHCIGIIYSIVCRGSYTDLRKTITVKVSNCWRSSCSLSWELSLIKHRAIRIYDLQLAIAHQSPLSQTIHIQISNRGVSIGRTCRANRRSIGPIKRIARNNLLLSIKIKISNS